MQFTDPEGRVFRMGVIGVGGGAAAMVPIFAKHPGFRWSAAADLDPIILERFGRDYEVETYTDARALCESPQVDAVYIATPNRFHREHAIMALENGKHVLCEKPMAITLEDADAMIDAADRNRVQLAVNVKHSFEQRVLKLREVVASKQLGTLRMMHYWFFNDWLYRPRTPEELTPEWGGGVPWRQAPHQLDIMRTIGGGRVRSVRGMATVWDETRHVPGVHSAFLDFEEGHVATAVYSGHDHFNSGGLVRGFGSNGPLVDPERHAQARKEFAGNREGETLAARGERYGGERGAIRAARSQRFDGGNSGGWMSGGPFILSFDHGDVWVTPGGLIVFGDLEQEVVELPSSHGDGRWGRVHTFYDALIKDEAPAADGRWGKATLEVILAIVKSGDERREIQLEHQTSTNDAGLAAAQEWNK